MSRPFYCPECGTEVLKPGYCSVECERHSEGRCPRCGGVLDQNLECHGECLFERVDRALDRLREERIP